MEEELIRIGIRRRELQNIPIGTPNAVPKRTWAKKKDNSKATARALTANKLEERQERQQHRIQREEERYQQAEAQLTQLRHQQRPKRPHDAFINTFRLETNSMAARAQAHQQPSVPIQNTREGEIEKVLESPPP